MTQQPSVRRIPWTDEDAAAMHRPRILSKVAIAAASIGVAVVGSACLVAVWMPLLSPSGAAVAVRVEPQPEAVLPLAVAPIVSEQPSVVAAVMPPTASEPAKAVPMPVVVARTETSSAGAAAQLERMAGVSSPSSPSLALGYAAFPARTATPWSVKLGSVVVIEDKSALARADDAPLPADPAAEAARSKLKAAVEEAETEQQAVSTAKVVRTVTMRSRPGKGRSIGALKRGTKVSVLECDKWCRVEADGRTGWVYSSYIKVAK
jgi:hypothetical protein